MFNRYMGVDYSGALTPTASLNGLRVYVAEGDAVPAEVAPPPSLRKYWSRRDIAEWLVERFSEGVPTLVGIDHGFSLPRCAARETPRALVQIGPRSWSAILDHCQMV
jgi:hypothetical protein